MQIRKILNVDQSTQINQEVHSGECLLVKESGTVITLPTTNASGTNVFAYTFRLGGVTTGLNTTLYEDGNTTIEMTSLNTVTFNGTPYALITAITAGAWNTFVLHDNGTELTLRINDETFTRVGDSVNQLNQDRTILNFPTNSLISGILTLWNADIPADVSGNLYYEDVTFAEDASAFYPLIENRSAALAFESWLLSLAKWDDTARWDINGFATFDQTGDESEDDVNYVNPYGNSLVYDVGGSELHGTVSGELVYSYSFEYANEYEALLNYPSFSDGNERSATLSQELSFSGPFAVGFNLYKLDMTSATIVSGSDFSAAIENGVLTITFATSTVNTFVGDAERSIRFGRERSGKFLFWVDGKKRAVGEELIRDLDEVIAIDTFFENTIAESLYDLKIWDGFSGDDIFEADIHFSGINNDWSETVGYTPAISLTISDGLIGDISDRPTSNLLSPIVNGDVPFNVRDDYAVYPTSDLANPTQDVLDNDIDGIGNANDDRVYHIVPGTKGYKFSPTLPFYTITLNVVWYGEDLDILNDIVFADSGGNLQSTQGADITIGGEYQLRDGSSYAEKSLSLGWNAISVTFDEPLPAGDYYVKNTFSDLRVLANPVSLAVLKGIYVREGA